MLKRKKAIVVLLMFGMILSLVPNQANAAKRVKLNKSKLSLYEGETYVLKLKNNKKGIKWSSSKKSIATVSKKGKVEAKKRGSCKITAKVAKKKYVCKVTVKKKAPANDDVNASKTEAVKTAQPTQTPNSGKSETAQPTQTPNSGKLETAQPIQTPNFETERPTETSGPEETLAPAPTDDTVFNNYQKLADFITKNGSTNKNGGKFILYSSSNSDYAIIYEEDNNQIQFLYMDESDSSSSESALSIYVKLDDCANGDMTYIILYKSGLGAELTAYVPLSDIISEDKTANVDWTLVFTTSDWIEEESWERIANLCLEVSYLGWNILLAQEDVGLTMADLGFGV